MPRPVPPEPSPWKRLPDMSPWRGRPLTIPPDSTRAWIQLAAWECWMGMLVCGAVAAGMRLIATAPGNIITVYDFSRCYGASPISQPCERVAYRAGMLNVVFSAWVGVLLMGVAAWLLWELWVAVAPQPITDDFLKLLDDSFGRDWRRPRTWPWARALWAYGFTAAGVILVLSAGAVVSRLASSPGFTKATIVHIETSQRFRSPEATSAVPAK
jgi:hypothetical protein